MAISTFTELETAVGNWLKRSTDLASYIPDFIMLGQQRIYRELRIRAMEAELSSVISSGTIALPSDYVELKYAYINGSPVQWLERRPAEWILRKYPTRSSESKPKFIAADVSTFIFGPYPDSAYTVKGTYYKRLSMLTTAAGTNWFTSNAPDLLLWASLAEAEPFLMNDQRAVIWEAKYQAAKAAVEKEHKRESRSGGPVRSIAS